jgi:uncharacterized protein YjbI with pentapeptide repeats
MAIEIKDAGGCVLVAIDSDSLLGANLSGLDLRGAQMRGLDLTGADLSWADLTGAAMQCCVLDGADLRNAKLSEHLYRATLRDALLDGVTIHWHSAELVSELLRRAAKTPYQLEYAIGGLAVRKCWAALVAEHHPLACWAIGVLAPWVRDGDKAPLFLKHNAAALAKRKLAEN